MVLEKRKSLTHSSIRTPDHITITTVILFLQIHYYLSRPTDSIYTYFVVKFCIVTIFSAYFFIKFYVSTSKGSLVTIIKLQAKQITRIAILLLIYIQQGRQCMYNILRCCHVTTVAVEKQ
jgi:hypothetical protein